MFCVVREYKVKPGQTERIVSGARSGILPKMQQIPGFVGYTLAMPGEDRVTSIGFWETEEALEESVRQAALLVPTVFGDLIEGTPKISRGRVLIRENRQGAEARYGMIRRFKFKPEEVESTAQKVREGLVPLLLSTPGFVAYAVLDCGNGDVLSLAAFESREVAESTAQRAATWSENAVPGVQPIETIPAEIKFRVVNPELITAR